ncbi:hypothetical protein NIES21_40520 [Anabaenopsis circularis NIES-21]|uniref:Uncharacterized protein n=1 Tax=Anabaenopsis circularis NIES-21 TaxID=1085406 RepID=A0A1Z4GLI1_9CYAN|nr:hypothetical protein NIES21_40520 [Anabaenopsis circularis NIES-21]
MSQEVWEQGARGKTERPIVLHRSKSALPRMGLSATRYRERTHAPQRLAQSVGLAPPAAYLYQT